MRKTLYTLTLLLLSLSIWGQIVSTNPTFITPQTQRIEIVFDATQGNAGLKDYQGDVYAHTGVITDKSKSSSDWKYAPTWGDNSPKYKLKPLGGNKWQLDITPNMQTYYGVADGEKIKKLAFVFRSADKKKEGKDVGNTDIFVDVFERGLNVAFVQPAESKTVTQNFSETIEIETSITADIELLVNGKSMKKSTNATSLKHPYVYAQAVDYQLVAKATRSGQMVYDTVNVIVPAPVVQQPRPSGVQDGITYATDGTSVTLVLHAPNKKNVFVIGDFSNWLPKNAYQMKKDGERWWLTINNIVPNKLYAFQYLVDGVIRIPDPYTELVLDPWNDAWIDKKIYPDMPLYPTGKTTELVATFQSQQTPYAWQITDFKIEHPDNVVIYELLLRDFTDEKSLQAAIQKLDYLKALGVTAIELLPIQEFDGNNSWGYNPNLFFAPDKAYGSPNMYKKFIDEAHRRGMGVILDMVFNHATGTHPFAKLYWDEKNNRPAADNPWMNVKAPHGFSVFNDFDHSYKGTRAYFNRVLAYWLNEYKVDGYRMDLTKGLTQRSGTENSFDQSRIDYLTEYHNTVKQHNPNAMFILEHLVGGAEERHLADKGMYLWRNVNNAYSQAAMGYQSDANFGAMNTLPRKWIGYAESHDEERNFYKAKTWGSGVIKTDSVARLKRIPLNIAFAMLTPGPKMIWQFGEIGYDYSINSFGGRVNEKPAAWRWLELPLRKKAYDQSAKIINLKRAYPAPFTQGNVGMQVGVSDWQQGKRIGITHSDLNIVVLGNFQPSTTITARPNFPKKGTWYELLTGQSYQVNQTDMAISIPAGEVRIYTDKKIGVDNGVDNLNSDTSTRISPHIVTDKIYIHTTSTVEQVMFYDMQGRVLGSFQTEKVLDVSSYKSGVYLIKIATDSGQAVHKFIKR